MSAEIFCDTLSLQILLEGDEQSHEYLALANHVDRCERCQQTLTLMAGDNQAWTETGELLRDYPGADSSTVDTIPCRDFLASQPADGFPFSTSSFLESPNHPEMLGRLGRYEVERVIGAGGMGIVLKAHDSELNRPVAIKVLAPHLCNRGAARKRFEREARAAAAVVHEHIVAIHNVDSDGKTPYIVMQYVPGESLQTKVDDEGPLPTKEVLRIGVQAAAGLAAAHEQGVIHRDVKPGNILLENDIERSLLSDFGLARTVDDASLTHTGVIAGTPHYMSPEQANGETVDHRTDLFSLGSVIYFMATGRPPFRADKPMGVLNRICHSAHQPACELNRDVPYQLSDLIDELLRKKAHRRLDSAVRLRERLSRQLAELQAGRPNNRLRRIGRNVRRHWMPIAALISAAGVLCALVAIAPQTLFPNLHNPKTTQRSSSVEKSIEEDSPTRSDVNIQEAPFDARALYQDLRQAETGQDALDFDQVDSFWAQESESLNPSLDQIASGVVAQ